MSIKQSVFSGVKWTTVSTVSLAVVAILKISILTRFLEKADFGLLAIVTFIIGFVELFNDMGITTAILHKQNITTTEYSSLYWLNLMISILLYIFIFVSAPLVATFYGQYSLNMLIPLLGVNLIISAIGRQFKVVKQKDLRFKGISIIETCGGILSLFVAIGLAMNDFGILSLVYASIIQALFNSLSFFLLSAGQHRIGLYFSFKSIKPFLRIGGFYVGGQTVNYFNRDLDILLVGKFFSPDVLGGYSLAKQLVFRPAQIINPILVKVASPALAKFQHEKSQLKDNYLGLVNIVSSINIIVYTVIILLASPVVVILYGPSFQNITLLVQILCVYMVFRAIGNPVGSLVVATGRTDLEFYWNLVTLIIMPVFIFVGALIGIEAVAISITISMLLLFYPSWRFMIAKMIDVSFTEYLRSVVNINYRWVSKQLRS